MLYKKMNKVIWIIWLLLTIAWHYYFPNAIPFDDVAVATILSIFAIYVHRNFTS